MGFSGGEGEGGRGEGGRGGREVRFIRGEGGGVRGRGRDTCTCIYRLTFH